jgi:hypothetical protein
MLKKGKKLMEKKEKKERLDGELDGLGQQSAFIKKKG